jgi:hypothetical protein
MVMSNMRSIMHLSGPAPATPLIDLLLGEFSSMTLILQGSDSAALPSTDATPVINPVIAQTAFHDADAFRTATSASASGSAEKHMGNVTLVDDHKCQQPEGFWARLGDEFSKMGAGWANAEAGIAQPDEPAAAACKGEVPVKPAAPAALEPGHTGGPDAKALEPSHTGGPDAQALLPGRTGGPDAAAAAGRHTLTSDVQVPSADAKQKPDVRLGDPSDAGQAPPAADLGTDKGGKDVPSVRLGDITAPAPADRSTSAAPGEADIVNPLLKGVESNIGKSVQELEPGINPRLGCVRMVSHAMHEADPTFPETNNAAAFSKALKDHGYEEVTVKPGDPALNNSNPGDVLVGRRPDGMPSHAAINMGDGKVFNNNSDSGKGQLDSLDQFKSTMHDSKGHWNKNGFNEVTIYRKKTDAPAASTTESLNYGV